MVTIDNGLCVRCGRCVAACPADVFRMEGGSVSADSSLCISCGHCVALCPCGAVSHDEFPSSAVHDFDRKDLPSAESVELLIKARRSNRSFADVPVPEELLGRIAAAGGRAPTASNLRQVGMVVVTDPDVLREISRLVVDKFHAIAKLLSAPVLRSVVKAAAPQNVKYLPVFLKMKDRFQAGKDPILHGAKAAIFFYTPDGCRFGCQDSNLAYQNASLVAESLGVAHFYTGFVCTAASMYRDRKIQKLLGIEGTVHAGMALGMPRFVFSRYVDRKVPEVKFVGRRG